MDLPDPALQGRKRLKASGKKELEAEASEIAAKIMRSHKEAEAEGSEGKENACSSKPEASEDKEANEDKEKAEASEGKNKADANEFKKNRLRRVKIGKCHCK